MSAAPKLEPLAPKPAQAATSPPQRHLAVVPPPPAPAGDETHPVRVARWIAVLLVVATVALFGVWTAAMLGATDSPWWPIVFGGVFAGVVALGVVVLRKTR
jgi:hypothetical protein